MRSGREARAREGGERRGLLDWEELGSGAILSSYGSGRGASRRNTWGGDFWCREPCVWDDVVGFFGESIGIVEQRAKGAFVVGDFCPSQRSLGSARQQTWRFQGSFLREWRRGVGKVAFTWFLGMPVDCQGLGRRFFLEFDTTVRTAMQFCDSVEEF